MQKQLTVGSKSGFHSHAAFLLPGFSPQCRREDQYASSSSSPLVGAAVFTYCLPALHRPQWCLSSQLQRAGAQSLAVGGAAPIYEASSLGAACLDGPCYCIAKRHLQWQMHLTAVKLRTSKKEFFFLKCFFPVQRNKSSTPTTPLPH